jgi:hypothetical protein
MSIGAGAGFLAFTGLGGTFRATAGEITRDLPMRHSIALTAAFVGAFLVLANPAVAQAPGRYALRFDGVNDWVFGSSVPAAYSIDAIVRIGPLVTTNNSPHLISQFYVNAPIASCEHGGALIVGTPGRNVSYYIDDTICGPPGHLVTSGSVGQSWVHLTATFDGALQSLYIDGMLVGSISNGSPTFNAGLGIGGTVDNQNLGAQFEIAELRLWNHGLTAAEVRAGLRERSIAWNDPGLIAMYLFYEGSGQVVHDVTMHGWNLRLGNSAGVDVQDPIWIPASGATPFGAGCAGSGACVPGIAATGPIQPGAVDFQLSNALGGAPAFLLLGLDEAPNAALPYSLDPPFNTCLVQVAPVATFFVPSAGAGPCAGTATVTLQLPTALPAGFDFTTQWATIDPVVSGLGIALSQGLAVRL